VGFGDCLPKTAWPPTYKSCTIAKPGIKAKDEHIAKMIAEGKVAFGLSVEHVEHAIPMLINHLK
ncbi:DUF2620 family protein, partial [Pseudomonas aeruginosa]|uniref:DUF2620 family protein n=1 Tax=Pseudomonas aeruginosa TaxID=287 RepID=UPI00301E5148